MEFQRKMNALYRHVSITATNISFLLKEQLAIKINIIATEN